MATWTAQVCTALAVKVHASLAAIPLAKNSAMAARPTLGGLDTGSAWTPSSVNNPAMADGSRPLTAST